MSAFASLPLPAPLLKAVDVLGFTAMTPVQEHSLPAMLSPRDVIAQARTGSGKTVAFGLALLARLDVARASVQAVVLCPTRELADQVSAELRRLARFIPNVKIVTLTGGVPVRTQLPSIERPPHVVVGTPGRIRDHLRRESLDLRGAKVLVLDEADRMLDMGFLPDIEDIAGETPADRQTLLFSATFPDDIRALSRSFQRDPLEVTVDTEAPTVEIEETFFEVDPARRMDALEAILRDHVPEPGRHGALVFCHTRNDVRDVSAALHDHGFSVLALHGEMEQRERDEVLLRFANQSCSVLVATDVAARGLDVKGLAAVVSYELPTDKDVHVHRVGRTGRAGQKGVAFALVGPRERDRVRAIEERQGGPVRWAPIPDRSAPPTEAPMVTLLVDGGKQDKLRPGDLLGALTKEGGLPGDAVGKIDVLPRLTYVAIRRDRADDALHALQKNPIKGRAFRVRRLGR